MDFELTEDQRLIQETVREFAQKKLKPLGRRIDEEEKIPDEIFSDLAAMNLFGMSVPAQYGGLELDPVSFTLAMEELAKASASVQVCLSVHNTLVCGAINRYGTDEQKKRYLPKLAKGELIGAYSLTEPSAGTDAGSLETTAILEDEAYIFNGTKSWCTNAGIAGIFIVFALTDKAAKSKGISCFIVEKGLDGFTFGKKEKKLSVKGSDTRELYFQDCRVPREAMLGKKNGGFKIALRLLDWGRVGIGAQALGIAQAAYEEALAYAKVRKQFGKTLAEFQAIAFKLADMTMNIEAARLLVYRAASLAGQGKSFVKEASMAKLFASEAANKIAYQAVQIFGAGGISEESEVERFFRDARVTEIYEGTSEAQRIVISREILKE